MNTRMRTLAAAVCGLAVCAGMARAEIFTWTGAAGSDWHDAANWNPSGVPGADDTAVVGAGPVLLTNATADLASFTLTGGMLTFSNWTTRLTAEDVRITNGTVTCAGPFTDEAMSNRVWFVCTDLTLEGDAVIDADGRGYAGGENKDSDGYGPGASTATPGYVSNHAAGPGYGGRGGDGDRYSFVSGGRTYGDVEGPALPGSGSSGSAAGGGLAGGGAIQIDATGHVAINGRVSANGKSANDYYSSGGSGGGIFIVCRTFGGSGGLVQADGGDGIGKNGAGAGGGRIGVLYDGQEQAAKAVPDVRFSAAAADNPGIPGYLLIHGIENYLSYRLRGFRGSPEGEPGTLYFPDNRFLVSPVTHRGRWCSPEPLTTWTVDSLVFSNACFLVSSPGLALTVSNRLQILDGSRVFLSNVVLQVGGDWVISNSVADLRSGDELVGNDWITEIDVGGRLIVQGAASDTASRLLINAGSTNGLDVEYGACVTVNGETRVGPYGWIAAQAHAFDGSAPRFRLADLTIQAPEGGFDADRGGFRGGYDASNGYGPGYGLGNSTRATGAGYGGQGGRSATQTYRGTTYGDAIFPDAPGSGGGGARITNVGVGGRGGGLIRIHAERVALDGMLTANGTSINEGGLSYSGGGSGGGILLLCSEFAGGPGGVLRANGGDASATTCGGGGGGRIAVWFGEPYTPEVAASRLVIAETAPDSYGGSVSVANGSGYASETEYSEPGTVRFVRVLPMQGTLLLLR